MISCLKSSQEKRAKRANPKGRNKEKQANCNWDAPYFIFDSGLGVSVTSKASVPDSVVCSDHSHLMQIFVSFFNSDVNWDVFNDLAIKFHIDQIRSDSTLPSLKCQLFFLLLLVVFLFLVLLIRIVFMLGVETHCCVDLISCMLSHIYVRVIAMMMLVQIRITSLSRTYGRHTV